MNARKAIWMAVALPSLCWGQAAPTATAPRPAFAGINFPAINGNFQYGLSASEIIQSGYTNNGGLNEATNISGDLAYTTKSEVRPLSLLYTGGVQFGNQAGYGTTSYQSLGITQSYVTRSWIFGVSDVISYLPQSPTVGLSGIPGTGDIGLDPVQNGLQPSQGILTINNNRVSNTASGNVQRQLDAFTSISGGASYGILHFFGAGGLDSSQISADVAINRRIDARSSASLAATYGTYDYSNLGTGASFATRGLSASYKRQLSRALTASVSGGPEWISSSSTLAIPSQLTYTASVSLGYTIRQYNAQIGYIRGITGGAGVQPGGISDSLIGSLQRPFGNVWSVGANIGYSRTQGLSNVATPTNLALLGLTTTGNYNSVFAGAQVSRRLSRSFSAFGSYTAINQSYSQVQVSPVALNGIVQSFALGISYFPRSLHLGQL
jgi:hypothetical protein